LATVRKRKWTHKGVEREAWVVSYSDAAGTRRIKTFEKKRDADNYRLSVEQENATGGTGTRLNMTVKALCEEFLRESAARANDGRIGASRHRFLSMICRTKFLPAFGARAIGDLTANDLSALYSTFQSDHGNKPSVARDRIYNISLILAYAVDRGYLRKNVAKDALRRLRGVTAAPIRTFSADELRAVVFATMERRKGQQARSHAFIRLCVHLALFCGLRRGEIFGLRPEDIDADRRVIRIRKSLTQFDELKAPKTRSGLRDVPAPPHVLDMLAAWARDFYVPNERGLLIRAVARPYRSAQAKTPDANPHQNFDALHWKKLLATAGLYVAGGDNLHFHALRHFAASAWITEGIPLMEVALLMGHARFDMTLQTYAHPIVGQGQSHAAVDRLAGRMIASARMLDATTERQQALTH